ncbi:MAG: ATP-dependent 6-phosphofructokinase [Thermodesulfobacteriota bacterium]
MAKRPEATAGSERSRRTTWPSSDELAVEAVGACDQPSPIPPHGEPYVDDRDRVLLCQTRLELAPFLESRAEPPSFEPAGPRPRIAFDPSALTCGVLTCGGLCPGLNNVLRAIVLSSTYAYGVQRILGFRYGYAGLAAGSPHEPMQLTPRVVDTLHEQGGTLLGSSRGPQDVGGMVDTLERLGVGILFVLGGDGGLRGASAIHAEIARRGRKIAVVGVPKTIDNDLQWTWRTFGFSTAVEAARSVIQAAHTEARAAWNGVGLVKLMGRHSGFIAAHATLASNDVNFCLVPEVPLVLEGEGGFLAALERRLDDRRHAVVVVAEGTGQDLLNAGKPVQRDASGNVKLADVGVFLRDEIGRWFAARKKPVTIRYFDPTYYIRSLPANPMDAQFCLTLGQHAVHAAMAGRTNMVVCAWSNRFANVPIPLVIAERRYLDPAGEEWQRVLETTGQRALMRAD